MGVLTGIGFPDWFPFWEQIHESALIGRLKMSWPFANRKQVRGLPRGEDLAKFLLSCSAGRDLKSELKEQRESNDQFE
jgi:hypothetical protein